MFRSEVALTNLVEHPVSIRMGEYPLISLTDAYIRYTDNLVGDNLPDLTFVLERSGMVGARSKGPKDAESDIVSKACLRITHPAITVLARSVEALASGEVAREQDMKAKKEGVRAPIGIHMVDLAYAQDDRTQRIFQAKRVMNTAYGPLEGPLDDFSLRVFGGADVGFVGKVTDEQVPEVADGIAYTLDRLLTVRGRHRP